MTVPPRVQGMSYTVNPEDPVSAPQTTYTARSVAVVGTVLVVVLMALALIVVGCWALGGWPVGLIALGCALIGVLVLVTAWPTPPTP